MLFLKKKSSTIKITYLSILEHKLQPKFDVSGDLNMDWIFPQHSKLNPDNIQFLWKLMKESGTSLLDPQK